MNRLWVRISMSFAGILIFLIVIPISFSILTHSFDEGIEFEEPAFLEDQVEGSFSLSRAWERLGTSPGRLFLKGLSRFFIITSLISILAGVASTRGLTAPLNKLASAANAIGAQDLSQRVEIKGSREIRAVAQAFNDMAEDLEKAENLRTNLLNDIAHELRTPLAVIQGNLRAILDDVYELDKAEIARLYDQTLQLSHLVDDLRELAQAEARQLVLNITKVDTVSWVKNIAAVFRPIVEQKRATLRVEIPGEHPIIHADRARLTQVLHNLLNNALQHTHKEGTITIRVEQRSEYFTLRVSDTGEGIAAEHLPHIFDRFYRSDAARARQTGGTGLGLAISQAIVQSHGGRITASSEGVGKGSEFEVQLPLNKQIEKER
jgi:two-component system, OmpR family, sensor kinase